MSSKDSDDIGIVLLVIFLIVAFWGDPDLIDLLERWINHTIQQYPEIAED